MVIFAICWQLLTTLTRSTFFWVHDKICTDRPFVQTVPAECLSVQVLNLLHGQVQKINCLDNYICMCWYQICLTNQWQFSVVYSLIDHKITSKNVQNSSGAAKFWPLIFLWYHLMVYKSIEHRKLPFFLFFTITWKK